MGGPMGPGGPMPMGNPRMRGPIGNGSSSFDDMALGERYPPPPHHPSGGPGMGPLPPGGPIRGPPPPRGPGGQRGSSRGYGAYSDNPVSDYPPPPPPPPHPHHHHPEDFGPQGPPPPHHARSWGGYGGGGGGGEFHGGGSMPTRHGRSRRMMHPDGSGMLRTYPPEIGDSDIESVVSATSALSSQSAPHPRPARRLG